MPQSSLFIFLLQLLLSLLLIQLIGPLANRLKMPRVFAEIIAGLILGPTVLKQFYPLAYNYLFDNSVNSMTAFNGIQELGLLLLMFCSGLEIEFISKKSEKRIIFFCGIMGVLIPFTIAYLLFPLFDFNRLMGTNANTTTIRYFFAITCAITSIPVISRIFIDLNLIRTSFANICLSVALIEDLVLYLILALTIDLNSNQKEISYLNSLNIVKGSWIELVLHITLTFFMIVFCFKLLPYFILQLKKIKLLKKIFSNYLTFSFIILLGITSVAIFLNIPPFLGAFLAGIVIARTPLQHASQIEAIKTFSFSTFIPLFFLGIGLKLDLTNSFDFKFFIIFILFSSLTKIFGVLISGYFSKFKLRDALNMGVTLNARGGPGIVLAGVGLSTQLISASFFVTLVLTALITSWYAGFWLNYKRDQISHFGEQN